jgi:hypothetical protein
MSETLGEFLERIKERNVTVDDIPQLESLLNALGIDTTYPPSDGNE